MASTVNATQPATRAQKTAEKAAEKAAGISLWMVRHLGRLLFEVPSTTRNTCYVVDTERGTCDCPGFYYLGVCPHLIAVTRCRTCAGELFLDYAWVGGRGHVLMLRCANTCGFGAWLGRAVGRAD